MVAHSYKGWYISLESCHVASVSKSVTNPRSVCAKGTCQACLDRWLDISGRHNCEICLHPLRDVEEAEDELRVAHHVFHSITNCVQLHVRDASTDGTRLELPCGDGVRGAVGDSYFRPVPDKTENVLLTGKWTNFLTLVAIFGVTNITPMRLEISVSKRDWHLFGRNGRVPTRVHIRGAYSRRGGSSYHVPRQVGQLVFFNHGSIQSVWNVVDSDRGTT